MSGERLRRRRDGSFELRLGADERALLRALPGQLQGALQSITESGNVPELLVRLFPRAYPTDDDKESAFVSLVRDDLVNEHLQALDVLVRKSDAKNLQEDELEQWLSAINDLRLVLGSSLDVQEDDERPLPDDKRYGEWICYHYLSLLEADCIEALSDALPEPEVGGSAEVLEDPWGEPPGGLRWDGTPRPDTN